jgi:rhamnose utilization protein RhaD (predicted bifunctional aldolase and dehydrogenase)
LKAAPPSSIKSKLTDLSHALGREDHALAILGEGNTSARTGSDTFWVKSSGSNLATLTREGLTECRLSPLVALLDAPNLSDDEIDQALLDSRVDSTARKPSVEAIFHAWLLALPEINFIGHTHPVAVNALLCSPQASDFANRRLFPDQIVCCGSKSVRVPYCDPGLILAQAIRSAVELHREQTKTMPRLILLENHGMIAIGASPEAVLATTLMAEKAARITLGALSAGGPNYLSSENVNRIASRTDEHYRQKALGL